MQRGAVRGCGWQRMPLRVAAIAATIVDMTTQSKGGQPLGIHGFRER